MSIIKINNQLRRVEVKDFELENEIVFNYLKNLPVADRDDMFYRAIYIGILALMEDRLAAFLSKTSNELGTELESLKMIFEMKKELFYKTSVKGSVAEEEVAKALNQFFTDKKLRDRAFLTGSTEGKLPGNKTGDIICELDGKPEITIAIECKFDKSIRMGDIIEKDIFTKKSDTVWSQLIESQANRDSNVSLIVLDRSLIDNSLLRKVENVSFIPEVGLISIIDSQKGDFTNLFIAYLLARDIAINAKPIDFDKNLLYMIVNRIIKDIYEIRSIRELVDTNIENNKKIIKQLEKSMLLMEFNQEYLRKFLADGTLNKTDLLKFYLGEEIKDKYKMIEKDIQEDY